MAIVKSAVHLIIREHFSYKYEEPVLTLGVPEIYATYAEIKDWFQSLGGVHCCVDQSDVVITTNETGRRFGWVSASTFFRTFGFSNVLSVDIPGCEHPPDLIHNLNNPLPNELLNRFNLVVDPGTVEHVFDIKTCLTNIVRALRIGGLVIHFVPIYSYNGGYFSINPNVLHDFYLNNGFNRIKAYIIMWDRYRPYTGKYRCYEYSHQLLGARHALADRDQCRFSPMLLFFAKKMAEPIEVASPVQSTAQFVSMFGESEAKLSERLRKIVYTLAFRLAYSYFPAEVGYYLVARANREWILRRTHRHSFWA